MAQTQTKGFIAGVGSERVIFDYLMTPTATGILAIDYDPEIITFHRINNLILSSVSPGDRETYLKFRRRSDFSLWEKHIEMKDRKSKFEDLHSWWIENIVEHSGFRDFHSNKENSEKSFSGLNYLHKDELFKRVQALSLSENYKFFQADLGKKSNLIDLESYIKLHQIKISVLDISNAWQGTTANNYLGIEGTSGLLDFFHRKFPFETLITTSGRLVQSKEGLIKMGIIYRAFSWNQITKYLRSSTFKKWEHFYEVMNESHGLEEQLIFYKNSLNYEEAIKVLNFSSICKSLLN